MNAPARVALALALFLALACSRGEDGRYVDEASRFRVAFPVAPRSENLGGPFRQHSWAAKKDNVVYGVMRAELPPEPQLTQDQRLDAAIADLSRSVGGTLVSSSNVSVSGRDGREAIVAFSGGRGMYRVRLCLDGDVFYQLVLTGANNEVTDPQADRFLASFEILKP